ncbi:MAG: C_GCAxxG_C_C family protein, partial [Clostridia bacterium]|nr:C_GCAxxG_C_C family protein [Clostridia bacterium]
MNHRDKAKFLFESGAQCAQATFGALCDVTGLPLEDALALSASFGGGMGRMREVCGALSG